MPKVRKIFSILFLISCFLFFLPHPAIADEKCPDDLYYTDTSVGEGACIHKYGGYYAPGDPKADSKTGCVYAFDGAADPKICLDTALVKNPAKGSLGPPPAGIVQLQELVRRFINISVSIAFLIIPIMLVIAGIKYLVSGGEAKAMGSAAGTVTWALLGALFLALAWIILKLIGALTGVDVTNFCFGFPGVATSCF